MQKGFALMMFSQTIRFMDRYYRFPRFIMVGKVRVLREDILRTYFNYVGTELTWYKLKQCRCELNAATRSLKQPA